MPGQEQLDRLTNDYGLLGIILALVIILSVLVIAYLARQNTSLWERIVKAYQDTAGIAAAVKTSIDALTIQNDRRATSADMIAEANKSTALAIKELDATVANLVRMGDRWAMDQERTERWREEVTQLLKETRTTSQDMRDRMARLEKRRGSTDG